MLFLEKEKQSLLLLICLTKNKEDYTINITTIADFLRINSNDIERCDEITDQNGCNVFIVLKRKQEFCPKCKEENIKIKEWKMRKVKHALFYEKETTFYIKIPRYVCKCCGKTFTQNNPYAPKRSRESYQSIKFVLNSLLNYNETFKSVADIYNLTNTTVMNIFDTYVNPIRKTLPKVLSIDEFYNNNQFSAAYSVLLFDFLKHKICDVILDRKKLNFNNYFNKLLLEEKKNVQYIVIDMWEPYLDIAKIQFPWTTVAIDSFHVMQHLSSAVHKVRCRIMHKFDKKSEEYFLLKKYGYLLKTSPNPQNEKVKIKRLRAELNEYQLLQRIIKIDPELEIIHNYYTGYKYFNTHSDYNKACQNFDFIIRNYEGVIIPELMEVVAMLIKWKEYILNSFICVDGVRLSNGPIEGANSQIKKLMKVANGYGNFYRFRNRIMFCYNKEINLSPLHNKITKIKRKPRGKYKKISQTQRDFFAS